MTVVGLTNLVLDYYFFDNEIYVNGGGTVSNILCNLTSMGINCKIFGYYGNDYAGIIAKKSLEEVGVNTSMLAKKNYATKKFFISKKGTTSTCPYCGKKTKNHHLRKNIQDFVTKEDIILIQDYTLIDDLPNKICLDFGYYKKMLYLKNNELEKFIFRNYYLVNIKEEALNFVLKKLNITFEQFKQKSKIYFLIITKGKKGATIIYNNKEYNFKPLPFKEVETNGCGDVFFATFISEVIKRRILTASDIKEIYKLAQKNVFTVINSIGARNHLVKNKIIVKTELCICENFKTQC